MNEQKISFDKWFELVGRSYSSSVKLNGEDLPAFPSDEIQLNTTGQSGLPTLKEAFCFYKDCVNTFDSLGKPIGNKSRVLDFGVGWGRIARFFLRDVPLENVHGIDVTPQFVDICRNTFRSDKFFNCDAFPPVNLKDEQYDFIVGYSVFSHLSEDACMLWMKEFSRLLVPGGVVAITTRGRPFLDFCESQKNKSSGYLEALSMLFNDFDQARAKYDNGEFLHSNIKGVGGGGSLNTSFYGETFIPESYARNAYGSFLTLELFMYNPGYQSHPIMFFRKA
jgi:ubiquinone/menaquinone biosynthesis C-methylase UbiE